MADPVTEFERYRDDLLQAVGDRDPVEVLRATLTEIERSTAGVSAEVLSRSPAPGEWSPWEVVAHLADNEMAWGVRVRMVITQDRPILVGYDQEAWTARFGGLEPDPHETLQRWELLRRANLRLYESLSPEEWQRIGLHQERGEQSVRDIVDLLAGHDVVHIDQLRRGLEAAGASQ